MRTNGGDRSRSDVELLADHVRGDRYAFADLIARHQDYLWAVARRNCRDAEDAADAVQEALLSAHRRAGAFRGECAVRSWLHRIVVNSCLDRLRRNAARPSMPFPEGGWEPADHHDGFARVDAAMTLRVALAELPDEQRMAVYLVDVEGRSVADAARMLGVARGTVKSRCARARLKLARALAGLREHAG
ncbi:RNA polymerase sigma factor SigM [Tomitella gaofuii]|uniref:RNA polymerase sigma factor SigM n=1 Tax=Tomitella gaofuii TaxID=2760083 RepID=UPI0015FC4162|nr:RNA polymerase sigma factor SigM [Tomitella gaofuii]